MGSAVALATSLISAPGFGQTTKPNVNAKAKAEPARTRQAEPAAAKPEKIQEDTHLYFFNETYKPARAVGQTAPAEGAIGQYVVGFEDARTRTKDVPDGKPNVTKETIRVRYVERPEEVSEIEQNQVLSVVRRYDLVSTTDGTANETKENKKIRGATISRRERPEGQPMMVMLSPVRQIDLDEYRVMTLKDVFAPYLGLILPEKALRVGETWKVRGEGASRLVGKYQLGNGELIGTLKEFRTATDGKTRLAIFSLAGRKTDADILAEMTFAFVPAPSPKEDAVAEAGELPYIPARGAIVKLKMATEYSQSLGRAGRYHVTMRRDLFFQRSMNKVGEPLTVPEKQIEPTPENSWLVFRDRGGRFSVRFPQTFPPQTNLGPVKPDEPLVLEHHDAEGISDLLVLVPVIDPSRSVAECFSEAFAQAQKGTGMAFTPPMGESRPSPKWPGMRVEHRIAEARSDDKTQPSASRLDVYVIRLDSGGTFIAESTTNRRELGAFNAQAESILKTIRMEQQEKK